MAEREMVPKRPFMEVLPEVQGALGEENQAVFAMAGVNMGRRWARTVGRVETVEELMEKMAEYLRDELRLAEDIRLEREGGDYVLRVRGCYVCHSDLVRERFGITPACPFSMFPVGAVREALKVRSARLKEIRKPGPSGDCDLVYEVRQ